MVIPAADPIVNEGGTIGSPTDNHASSSNREMTILTHNHHRQQQQQLNKRLFLRELDHREQVVNTYTYIHIYTEKYMSNEFSLTNYDHNK